jgi:hypothetical protein
VQQTSVTPNARDDIAGWLGGTETSTAELAVQFTGASGRILATAAIGPAGKQAKPGARLPAGGRHGSRGRDAGPGDDHADDHPHRLEWP